MDADEPIIPGVTEEQVIAAREILKSPGMSHLHGLTRTLFNPELRRPAKTANVAAKAMPICDPRMPTSVAALFLVGDLRIPKADDPHIPTFVVNPQDSDETQGPPLQEPENLSQGA